MSFNGIQTIENNNDKVIGRLYFMNNGNLHPDSWIMDHRYLEQNEDEDTYIPNVGDVLKLKGDTDHWVVFDNDHHDKEGVVRAVNASGGRPRIDEITDDEIESVILKRSNN